MANNKVNNVESKQRGQEKKGKRYSIFTMLILLLIALVVVPLISFAVKAINDSKKYLEDTLRERQLKTAKAAASHIQSITIAPENKLKTLIASFEIYSSEKDVLKKYNELVEYGILDLIASKDMPVVEYIDTNGNRLISYYKNEKGSDASNFPILSDKLVQELSMYLMQAGKKSIESNGLYSSPVSVIPITFSTKIGTETRTQTLFTPVKIIAMPIRQNDNSPVASIIALANLSPLKDALEAYGREFTLFLTDLEGKLICQTDERFFKENEDLSSEPVVRWAITRFRGKIFETSPTENTTVKGDNGEEILVTCSPILEEGLLLFSYVPKNKFFETITNLERTSTLWVALSIFAALMVGVFTARKITKPIIELTEQSRRLAKHDFEAKAEVKTKNEVGELAEAFNSMADDIKNYINEVNKKAEENKALFLSSIEAIVQALDAKDPYTKGHSARVSAYSLAIAKEYGIDDESMDIVKIASLLHDVGKIGIEDRLLQKASPLTNEEFEIMKSHVVKGAEIMQHIPQMKEMIPGIKYHHEKWSGGGYPDGLKGSSIPLLARIVGIADAFDAMTTDRPYQKAMSFEMAAKRIKELTPKVYDPAVTGAFLRAYEKGLLEKVLKITEVKSIKEKAV